MNLSEEQVKAILKRIDALVIKNGMGKYEFYKKSTITSAQYSNWNTGKSKPSMKKLTQAAEVLGTTVDYLLTGEEAQDLFAQTAESAYQSTPTASDVPPASDFMRHEWDFLYNMLTEEQRKLFIIQIRAVVQCTAQTA